jgi:hypothetical protein
MASNLTELSADNSENYPQNPQKLVDSRIAANPEFFAIKHQIIDSDESQQKDKTSDVQELHFWD